MKFNLSMVEYVKLQSNNENLTKELLKDDGKEFMRIWSKMFTYANFLSQKLEICMFVACDENGNVLDKYVKTDYEEHCDKESICRVISKEEKKYQTAQSKVIFEGFDYIIDESPNWLVRNAFRKIYDVEMNNSTIEDLIPYNIDIKESVAKELGLI